jgi:hypothetical protein
MIGNNNFKALQYKLMNDLYLNREQSKCLLEFFDNYFLIFANQFVIHDQILHSVKDKESLQEHYKKRSFIDLGLTIGEKLANQTTYHENGKQITVNEVIVFKGK